ncbi:DUF4383 domain-containing protein [Nocardia sp. AG03]|uniref:DUF4383 domain-containing protein n=1 Tax=Nocardia sp. AG03 TaxID=3025312 RepID=UPI0024185085|nr:DUF4383 domain-containing protein [Nocardia sp. AG03]
MSFARFRAAALRYVSAVLDSPLQFAVFLFGVWFTLNGVIAFGVYPDMAFGHSMHACTIQFLGFIPVTVNGWHALFHLVTGLLGLVLAPARTRATRYLLANGPFYLLIALLGFVGGDNVLRVMAVDTFGSVVHAIEGAVMVILGATAVIRGRSARR